VKSKRRALMSNKISEEILATLKEMLKWLKFTGIKEVRTVLMNVLNTEQKRMIYHLSDGEHGTIEIGKVAKVSDGTVRQYWKAWSRLGLMEPMAVKGGTRYKKSFEIEDFGFDVPQIKLDTVDQEHVSKVNSSEGKGVEE
jgi:hypothetical protein